MLDFPNSPTNGQLFTGANGVIYQWNAAGGLWLNYGVGMNSAIVSLTPPANPVAGQMWWRSDTGQMFIWYNDGNSTQWVSVTAPSVVTQPPVTWRMLSRQVVSSAVPQVDFPNIPSDINELMFRVGNAVPVNNDVGFFLQYFDGTGAIDATAGHYSASGVLTQVSQAVGSSAPASADNAGTGIRMTYNAVGNGVYNAVVSGISVDGSVINIRNATQNRHMIFKGMYPNGGGTSYNVFDGGGFWFNNASIISGARFFFGSGNIASGAFELWGSP
jgi:hypothetical protein